jgi:hypothetical protein
MAKEKVRMRALELFEKRNLTVQLLLARKPVDPPPVIQVSVKEDADPTQ